MKTYPMNQEINFKKKRGKGVLEINYFSQIPNLKLKWNFNLELRFNGRINDLKETQIFIS